MRKLKYLITLIVIIVTVGIIGLDETSAVVSHETIYEMPNNIDIKPSKKILQLDEKGIMRASWYGPKFHGKLTANGEVYNQMALTAAHKTLPFGTMLKLTNPENHKSVIVRINDRGPYVKGRHIDLSKGAAIALGSLYKGVINVEVIEISTIASLTPDQKY